MHLAILNLVGLTVSTYSLLMALAVLVGAAVAVWDGRRRSLIASDILDATIVVLIAGVIGARLEYVLLNLDYFVEAPIAGLRLWEGGFALHGGLWLGTAALIVFARVRRLGFRPVADALALGLAASTAIGWLACLFAGCAFGRTGFGSLHFIWPDAFGVTASRFAVQPIGAVWAVAVFLLLVLARNRLIPGSVLLLCLALTACAHFALGFQRADDTLWWAGWRADQWASAAQTFAALAVLAHWYLFDRLPLRPDSASSGPT